MCFLYKRSSYIVTFWFLDYWGSYAGMPTENNDVVGLDVWSPHDPKFNWLCPLDGCLVLSWRVCDPRSVCKRKFWNSHSFNVFLYSQRIYGMRGPFNKESQQLWGRHFIFMISFFFLPSDLYIFFSPSHTQSGVLLLPLTALIWWCLETTVWLIAFKDS